MNCWRYVGNGYEIWLEPCLNGFDVASYKGDDLILPKICTDVPEINSVFDRLKALHKAIEVANELQDKITS